MRLWNLRFDLRKAMSSRRRFVLLCLYAAVLTTCCHGATKIAGSKYRGGGDSSTGGEEDESCSDSSSSSSSSSEPIMPRVVRDGQLVPESELPIASTFEVDGRSVHLRPIHDELQLTYVHNLIAPDEIDRLVELASARKGWARSPLKSQQSGDELQKDDRRNSSSCPMLWPVAYASRLEQLGAAPNGELLLAELQLVTTLTSRVADLFTQTGMELTHEFIEPLQLVRYTATELFQPHHDYHDPGPDGKLGSSVQGEQRAFTVLLLGATLPPEGGGETHFPHLKVMVSPRKGDAIIWANVDGDGMPNPRSLHEGRPPSDGFEKVAVNCWIADRQFDLGAGKMAKAVRTGE